MYNVFKYIIQIYDANKNYLSGDNGAGNHWFGAAGRGAGPRHHTRANFR